MNRGLNTDQSAKSNASRAEVRGGERGRTDPLTRVPEERVAVDVSAIVVNRDGGEALGQCLESLSAQRGVAIETLVVDNGSRSDEAKTVRDRFPGVRVVPLSRNLGFAGGVNEGIARTSGEFVLVVNNDARLAPDYAARLAARLALDGRLAAAQGMVLRDDGQTIDTAGLSWNRRGEAVPLHAGGERFSAGTEPVEVPGVSATAAMYRRAALDAVADHGRAFDDSFFAYYEDVDLSLRLARAGWRFVLDPEAVAFHRGSMTGGRTPWKRSRWIARNRWRTLLKNFDHAFLMSRLADLLKADLAHARSLGAAGWILPLVVWPGAALSALAPSRGGMRLTGFPAALPAGSRDRNSVPAPSLPAERGSPTV
jgi:GT2 family glycosyltransferase